MPDIRMNIEAPTAVTPECDDPPGIDIVTGQRGRHDKGRPVDRMEKLTAVRMVVQVPEKDLPARRRRGAGSGLLGITAPTHDKAAIHRLVVPHQDIAVPGNAENTFHGATVNPGPFVQLAPALHWPWDDLDGKRFRIIDQATVSPYRVIGCFDQRHVDQRQRRFFAGLENEPGVACIHLTIPGVHTARPGDRDEPRPRAGAVRRSCCYGPVKFSYTPINTSTISSSAKAISVKPSIFDASVIGGEGASTRCFSSSPAATRRLYSTR